MNQKEYRAQVDAIPFSPDFQARTIARLAQLAQEKEQKTMQKGKFRIGLVAAVAAAALTITAYAAVVMLRPQDVAREVGNTTLAAAFEGEDAIAVNDSQTVGEYNVTLMGLLSGQGLSLVEGLPDSITRDKTYAVLAYSRIDGDPITDDVPQLTVSPLVEGYAPWEVNAWTLEGGTHTFAQEGVLYYLFECDNVEPFADRAVYLAVYPGTHLPPNAATFAISDEGHISVKTGAEAVLFPLPLEKGKADAQKVADMGFALWEPIPEEAPLPQGTDDQARPQPESGVDIQISGDMDESFVSFPSASPQN
ncbi:MAG: hypothetical protein HFF07_02690 [Oscillospiraceae bacterium]|jgi:hypothetical protein|nr:hypothetical protein [Oscillospiraceae bacterium]